MKHCKAFALIALLAGLASPVGSITKTVTLTGVACTGPICCAPAPAATVKGHYYSHLVPYCKANILRTALVDGQRVSVTLKLIY